MRALLLAAGLGTRLRPLTDTVPKCLVEIKGIALLDYWLATLLDGSEVDRVLINTGHLADVVERHVRGHRHEDRIDLVHEAELLGTGGTVLANRGYFGRDAFLVAHADNLTRFGLKAFIARHHARPGACEITMMTFSTDAPHSCGIVEQDDRGIVIGFHEKVATPPGVIANGAVYIFQPSVCDFMAALPGKTIDISNDVLPAYLGRIVTFHNRDYHRDIGTSASLELARSQF